MVKKIIKIPIYKLRLCIIFTDENDVNNVYSFLLSQGMPDSFNLECAATIDGWIKGKDNLHYKCIYMIFNFDDELTNGTITHEVIHFVNGLFTQINAKIDQVNDEPQAYLAQWATNKIYEFLKKEGKIIK